MARIRWKNLFWEGTPDSGHVGLNVVALVLCGECAGGPCLDVVGPNIVHALSAGFAGDNLVPLQESVEDPSLVR